MDIESTRQMLQTVKADDLVEAYLDGRNKKKAIMDEAKDRCAKIESRLEMLEAEFQRRMQEQGLESLVTSHGTAYTSMVRRGKVDDMQAFFEYVVKENAIHLLAARCSDQAVAEFTESHGTPPPGVTLTTYVNVNVRKK